MIIDFWIIDILLYVINTVAMLVLRLWKLIVKLSLFIRINILFKSIIIDYKSFLFMISFRWVIRLLILTLMDYVDYYILRSRL